MAVIELDELIAGYSGVNAINGITCVIPEGAVGLLGPNGAGKSTLLKTLLGFHRPTSGRVSALGFQLPQQALEVRQRTGYMPEYEVVSPKVSAVSFLTYCGRLFGMSHVDAMERTHEVLNYVGLGESRYRKMETYSTGMLQRVKLGQALVHDPKLLLLDEPTNGLDPQGRIEMLELIRQISSRPGVSVVLSSHLLPDVQHVCQYVVMMERGHIVREGAMEDLMKRHDREFEVQVRDQRTAFLGALHAAGLDYVEGEGGILRVVCGPGGETRPIFEAAKNAQTQIRHFAPARNRLEETFMSAVGHTGEKEPQGN